MKYPLIGLTIFLALPGSDSSAAGPSSHPNIIVILADDLGYGDLGCYGNLKNRTPNLDRMAAEGLRFTDFHSNGPMCSPTRAALLTGRYPHRAGIETALGENEPGLALKEITIAERLHEAGYASAIFGKWHLGRPDTGPSNQGFDEFHGLLTGDGDYASHVDRVGRPDWWHDRTLRAEPGYTTTLLTEHAEHFIAQHRDRPFFLYVPHLAIHFPWMAPGDPASRRAGTRYTDLSKLGPHEDVGPVVRAMIEALDASVGRILDAVRRQGLAERTLVVFTSDNGGYLSYANLHRGQISSNGPLRGQKSDVFEGGHRVPMLAWWPGRIPHGAVTEATALSMDLFPTALELAGLPAPGPGSTTALDGVSLVPLLWRGEPPAERALFWRIRARKAARRGDWKLVVSGAEPPQLFNLRDDPGETRDLTAARPDIVKRLTDELTSWERRVDPQRHAGPS